MWPGGRAPGKRAALVRAMGRPSVLGRGPRGAELGGGTGACAPRHWRACAARRYQCAVAPVLTRHPTMLRDSFLPAVRLVTALTATVIAAAAPRVALAQAAAVPATRADSAPVRWEHAELAIELDGAYRAWATRDSIYAGDDLRKFARRIGAPQLAQDVPSQVSNVRLLDHFAAQGWELVQCETRPESLGGLLSHTGIVRRCLFRRPRREAPPA